MTCMTQPVSIPEHLFVAIDHVGVAVPDLDEAIAFYRDVFGMRVAHEETIASRTPCSTLVSSCTTRIPNTSR